MEVLITIIVSTSVIFLLANNSNKTSTAKHRVSRAVRYPQPPNPLVSSVKPSTMEVMMTKNTGRQPTRQVNSLTKSNKIPKDLPATASDAQKSKVYRWEHHMVWNYNGESQIFGNGFATANVRLTPLTIDQSRELVDKAVMWWWRTNDLNDKNNARLERSARVPRVPTVIDGGRRRVAAYYRPIDHIISLPEWARYPEVILHECAHFIQNQHGCRNNCDGGHCAHFMGIYIHLLKKFMGMNSKILARSARASGIEVKFLSQYRFLF